MSAFQWNIVAGLSDRTSLPVLVVDYPLAPARCAPDAFALTNAVIDYAQLLYKRVILVGDSAGGGLCASLAMQRRDLSLSQVDGLILYSPWVDVTMTNPGYWPPFASRPDAWGARPEMGRAGLGRQSGN